jgi:hypothetical protein
VGSAAGAGLRAGWQTRAVVLAFSLLASTASAQQAPGSGQTAAQDPRLSQAVDSLDARLLEDANRPVTLLRARVLANMPADRARAAASTLVQLAEAKVSGPSSVRCPVCAP